MNWIEIIAAAALAIITTPICYVIFRAILTKIRTPLPKIQKVEDCDLNKIMGYDFIIIQDLTADKKTKELPDKKEEVSAPEKANHSALATDISPVKNEQDNIEQVNVENKSWNERREEYWNKYNKKKDNPNPKNKDNSNTENTQNNENKNENQENTSSSNNEASENDITFTEESNENNDWNFDYDDEDFSKMMDNYDSIEKERLLTIGMNKEDYPPFTPKGQIDRRYIQEQIDRRNIQEKLRRATMEAHREFTEEEQNNIDKIVNQEEESKER